MQIAVENKRSPYRFLIEALLFLSYFVFGLSWIGYSPFLRDFQSQFSLSHANTGMIISAVSFPKIFLPLVASYFALKVGVSRTLKVGMLLICASLLTPFVGSFPLLLATRVVFGMGGAIVITLIGSSVLQWFPADELPLVNGFNYVAVNSGITLALFITPQFAQSWGRVPTLAGYASISALIALAWIVFGKDGAAAGRTTSSSPSQNPASRALFLEIFRWKQVWWLTLAALGPLCIYLVFNTWLPTYYRQIFGMSLTDASRLTGLSNMVGIPSAIIGGLLTQRMTRRKPLLYLAGAMVGLSAFGLFLTPNLALLHASAVVFGIGLFLWLSPLSTIAMELPGMNPGKLAVLNGIFYGIGYLGAFIAPILAGAIKDHTGSFIPGFSIYAVFSWSLLFATFFLPETGKPKGGSQSLE